MNKLIFIYNANSDFISSTLDYAHKLLRPSTYSCNLCTLTHGNLRERKNWKEFRENLDIQFEFLHKNEWEKLSHKFYSYPIILSVQSDNHHVFIHTQTLDAITSIETLIELIKERLNH